ncbi:TorF family putative porin [Uliginosibacterium sediminicola]|uniref:TorF family putative porin n=1 Tax=Uliginosibacterium sediminicola TaxID=2024550 RepID=A0ABU9YUC4_9RHOO
MRLTLIAASVLAVLSVAPAFAEDAPSPVTGNFTIASEYVYRGIAQTNRKPAVQGGLDYAGPFGLYAGTWASSISWLSDSAPGVSAPMEWDFYGGIKFPVGPVGLDFGVLKYYYPGTYPTGFASPDTLEVYGAASYEFATFKYSYSLTNLFGAQSTQLNGSLKKSEGSQYFDLSANPDLGGGFTLNLHVGRQLVANFPGASYNDWKAGVTKDVKGWAVGLAYIGTSARASTGDFYRSVLNRDLGSDRIVATVGKTF